MDVAPFVQSWRGAESVRLGMAGVADCGTIPWKERHVEDYFRQVRRFKEELTVLVHMSAGAPARATGLISIHPENGVEARSQRGVLIDNGMVSFVTAYHKGLSAGGKTKIIHRWVPNEVGELVVY